MLSKSGQGAVGAFRHTQDPVGTVEISAEHICTAVFDISQNHGVPVPAFLGAPSIHPPKEATNGSPIMLSLP